MKQKDGTHKRAPGNEPAVVAPMAQPPPPAEPLTPVAAPLLAPDQIENLKSRAAKADEHWDRLLRTMADFENFKKRAARERHDAVKYGNEALIQKLIPILDNLDIAHAAIENHQAVSSQSLQDGIAMIWQQLKGALAEAGLEEVDASGKPFDPHLHEAVTQQETAELPEGYVVQQLRKGYQLRGRLLRPAAVIVAKKPAAADPASGPAT